MITIKTHNGRLDIYPPDDEWDSPMIYIWSYDDQEDRVGFSVTNDEAKQLANALLDVTHE